MTRLILTSQQGRVRRRGVSNLIKAAILGILAIAPVLGLPSLARADVAFLGPASLVVQRTPTNLTTSFSVLVQNGSTSKERISLTLLGLVDVDGVPVQSTVLQAKSDTKPLPTSKKKVRPGSVASFSVSFQGSSVPLGTYSGNLFAYASDGTNVSLPVTLIVTSATQATMPIRALDPGSTSSLTRSVSSQWFSPFTHTATIKIPVVDAFAGSPKVPSVVGEMANDREEFASVVRGASMLTVSGIAPASEYKGQIHLLQGQTGGDVTLTIQNRDYPLVPFCFLSIGVLGSILMGWWVKSKRAAIRLEADLKELKEDAENLQAGASPHSPIPTPEGGPPPGVYLITSPQTPGVLDTSKAEAVKEFGGAETDADRTKWGPGGTEFVRIKGYVDSLAALYKAADATYSHLKALHSFFSEHDHFTTGFDELAVVKQVNDALAGRMILSAKELGALQSDLKAAGTFLDGFRETYEKLVQLEHAVPATHPDLKAEAIRLQREMLGPEFDTSDLLDPLREDVAQLILRISASQVTPAAPVLARFVDQIIAADESTASGVLDDVMEAAYPFTSSAIGALPLTRGTTRPSDLADALAALRPAKPVEIPSSQLYLRLRRSDRYFNAVSFGLVVASGMFWIYGKSATFGASQDYLAIFLWGFGLDVGVKLVRQFSPAFVGRLAGA